MNALELQSAFRDREDLQGVRLAVLFGSRSKGTAHSRSDWDIAVLADSGVSMLDLDFPLSQALQISSDPIDVVDLRYGSPLLAYAVAREGKLLYESHEGCFADFQSLAFRQYADTRKFRQRSPEYLQRTISRWKGVPMPPLQVDVVLRKLKAITFYLETLAEYEQMSLTDFVNDFKSQLVVERLLQLTIEAATDALSHLLTAAEQPPPDTYRDTFVQASRAGMITPNLAKQLLPSAGLRNRLVYAYEELLPEIIFQTIPVCLSQYREYVVQIDAYLQRQLLQQKLPPEA